MQEHWEILVALAGSSSIQHSVLTDEVKLQHLGSPSRTIPHSVYKSLKEQGLIERVDGFHYTYVYSITAEGRKHLRK